MGAGILPATIKKGKIYFLFGKENKYADTPGFSDFGGGTDKGETFIQTAIREGGEELTGFLGSNKHLKQMLNKYGTYNIDYKSDGYSTYRCHIFPMIYNDQLTYFYNNNQLFLQKRLDPKIIKNTKIFEKTQIKWFSINDIKKNYNQFRTFYKNIIDTILNDQKQINMFVRTKLKTKQTNKVLHKKSIRTRKRNK
jgi:8-oxo-dGTP pyrophosphatase MutT (NUDIX family)